MYHSNLTQAHNIHWLDWDIYLFSLNSVLLDWVIDTSLNETPSIRASTKLHPFWMGHRPKPSWFCTFELGYRYEQQHNIILFLKGNEIKMVFQKQPQPKQKRPHRNCLASTSVPEMPDLFMKDTMNTVKNDRFSPTAIFKWCHHDEFDIRPRKLLTILDEAQSINVLDGELVV
jgi:hypothetical protein